MLVPGDLDPETQARGGIRLQGDEEVNRVIVLLALLDTMESLGFFSELLPDFGPLLSVTETVVEDNEVIGGVGAGIDVRETSGYKQLEEGIEIGDAFGAGVDLTPIPEDGGGFQVLFDLQVRGNQVRDMAGAGLAIDRGSLAVNVEVADNRFLDCGGEAARQYLGFTEGGVAISHAVFCRLSGNQVVRCGNGVFLDHVFNLDLSDNHVLRNGGGVFLYQVRGSVTLRDNELLYNQGLALGWYNHELQFDEAVLGLILFALAYLRPPLVQGEDLAAITDNVLHAGPAADPAFGTFGTGVSYHGYAYTDLNLYMTGSMIPGFAYLEPPSLFWLDLAGMPLTFDANTCHGQVGPLGWIHNLDPGVITGNLFRFDQDITPLWIANMASGVITSNVSGNSNPILVTGSSGVRHGFNVPDIGPDPIP